MHRRNTVLILILLIAGIGQSAIGQENNSFPAISIDFGAGYPIYVGDFYRFNQPLETYQGSQLNSYYQYNQSHFSGNVTIPLGNIFAFRIKASQYSVNYTEQVAQVNFKNTIVDLSALFQLYIVNQGFGLYTYAGAGVEFSKDAEIYALQQDMQTAVYDESVRRLSTTGGLGMHYWITNQFSVFLEGEMMFTGSDRVDGYYGTENGLPRESEKSYFSRDKFLAVRGGVRFRLTNPARPVAERPENNPVSSFVPDPNATDEKLKEGLPDEMKGKPPLYQELGVKQQLDGYTVKVQLVRELEELKRQKKVAEDIVKRLPTNKDLKVYLLEESYGYSVHIGYFTSYDAAKSIVRDTKLYYAGVTIQRN